MRKLLKGLSTSLIPGLVAYLSCLFGLMAYLVCLFNPPLIHAQGRDQNRIFAEKYDLDATSTTYCVTGDAEIGRAHV